MKTEKPTELIELLQHLLAETEKMNVGKIYIAIMEEIRRITFAAPSGRFTELAYKHLIELSIKDYVHSGRSEKSSNVINDIIVILSEAGVAANWYAVVVKLAATKIRHFVKISSVSLFSPHRNKVETAGLVLLSAWASIFIKKEVFGR